MLGVSVKRWFCGGMGIVVLGMAVPAIGQQIQVAVTQPQNGTVLMAGAECYIGVEVYAPTGVQRVDFFVNGVKIADDWSAPYGTWWHQIPAGQYHLHAVAYDNMGASAGSSMVMVNVVQPMPSQAGHFTGLASNQLRRWGDRCRVGLWNSRDVRVRMDVLTVGGRAVRTLCDRTVSGGYFEVFWSGDDHQGNRVPSGLYLIRVVRSGEREDEVDVRKVLVRWEP